MERKETVSKMWISIVVPSYKDKRFGCKRCRYKFGELTGTYLGEFYFSLDVLVHLLYLYALGVYQRTESGFMSHLSLATIERTFRVFRQSIYNESLQMLCCINHFIPSNIIYISLHHGSKHVIQ